MSIEILSIMSIHFFAKSFLQYFCIKIFANSDGDIFWSYLVISFKNSYCKIKMAYIYSWEMASEISLAFSSFYFFFKFGLWVLRFPWRISLEILWKIQKKSCSESFCSISFVLQFLYWFIGALPLEIPLDCFCAML